MGWGGLGAGCWPLWTDISLSGPLVSVFHLAGNLLPQPQWLLYHRLSLSLPCVSEDALGRSPSVRGCRCPVSQEGEGTQTDQRPLRAPGASKGASSLKHQVQKEAQEDTVQEAGVRGPCPACLDPSLSPQQGNPKRQAIAGE